ncbi:MAG: acyl-CoA desaturase [Actinomycetota bacterium]|nr:acyl-CoA desaturase [Actinomycetota bacterium]
MLVNATTRDINDGYVELSAQVRDAGLLDRRHGYYAIKGALSLAALAAAWATLFVLGNTWIALAVAAALGILFTQIVFFGHDAGHHQIFDGQGANKAVGLVAGNLLTGLSFGWWVPKHGAHHAHPNQIDRDPDIGPGAIAFTADTAANRRRPLGRVAARYQAWTFFPLLTFEGAGLHLASIQHLRHQRTHAARIETTLIALHTAAYLTAIFWVLSPLKGIIFIAIHQAVFGLYMGCSFAPNHKGMPTVPADARPSFAERQVLTARNVTGGALITFLLGGLNYQIEHHLFPRMPRANLVRSRPLIQAFCNNHGLHYHQDNIIGSYRAALTHLHTIGAGGNDPILPSPVSAPSAAPVLRSAS